MSNDLIKKIEAILFYLAEPVQIGFLAKTLEVSKSEISDAILKLKEELNGRGVKLIEHNEEVSLVTAPEFSDLIEKIIKEDRERDLGRAGIETLTIVAYKGPVSKKEIENVRGVNSQYAIRNLLLRGLISKKSSQNDERMVVYEITGDTLQYLGLGNISELPEYNELKQKMDTANSSPESEEE